MSNPIDYWYQKYIALKEEMNELKKGMVEGRITQNSDTKLIVVSEPIDGYVAQRVHGELFAKCQVPKSMNLQFGDKVRIIIVKEDKQ